MQSIFTLCIFIGAGIGLIAPFPSIASNNHYLVADKANRLLIRESVHQPSVPASTMKLLTSLMAIEKWGLQHRFHTNFYVDKQRVLWVQSQGDPMLTSESLKAAAIAMKALGHDYFAGIGIDDSYFAPLSIPGRSQTDNAYDTPVTSLAINFNTIFFHKNGQRITSAEPQTPITLLVNKLGKHYPNGKHRINLKTPELARQYAAEIIRAIFQRENIHIGNLNPQTALPLQTDFLYQHASLQTLEQILSGMLHYSTNFTANALFVQLSHTFSPEHRTMKHAQSHATNWARDRFHWSQPFKIQDGAGLSRGNQLSAQQLLDVLNAFRPYAFLLRKYPSYQNIQAKTGTLTGVSTMAGYLGSQGKCPFVIMLNEKAYFYKRHQLAASWKKQFSQCQ